MKIKNIFKYLLALPVLLSTTACSDWLEVKPQNVITIDEFWNEKADVDGMIAGLYTTFESQNVVERMMVWGEFRSDNISTGANITKNPSLENVFRENINASNGYTTWDQFYYIINQANTIIDKAPAVAEKDPAFSESELKADIAECSALRDLAYFYLIRTFRDVPYTTTAYYDDDQVMDLPATKFDDVLDSLITDLEKVKDDAVVTWPASSSTKALYQTARITRTAIYAMLCDMYLWKQDYQNCIKYADLVINDKMREYKEKYGSTASAPDLSRFNGYPLISGTTPGSSYFGRAYSTIFGNYGKEETGNSLESILELNYMSADNMPSNGAVNALYGPSESGTGYGAASSYVKETTDDRSSTNYIYYYRDARYYENINNSAIIAKYQYTNSTIDISNSSKPFVIYGGRFTKDKVKGNWIIYRLTDVMLMKAEALAAMMSDGSTMTDQDKTYRNQAFSLVNAVNKRSVLQTDANLKDTLTLNTYDTKDKMQTLVMDERQRELMFEGKRYYDLVRRARRDGNTSVLSTDVLHKFSSGGSAVSSKFAKMDYIYWPYNVDELKVNKHLKQNPAFGSGENTSIERN